MPRVVYFTDPACPWSWAAEPALRRLEAEFAADLEITYVMGGFAREFDDPSSAARETLDAAAAGGMPADVRPWLAGEGPSSSYPGCQAVKAAGRQGLDGPMLRVLREGFMVDGERQDSMQGLLRAGRRVEGLDLARFEDDLRDRATMVALAEDLDRTRAAGGRMPVLEIAGTRHETIEVAALRDAVAASGATPAPLPGVAEAPRRFGRLATAEVAAACGLPVGEALAELSRLALAGELRAEAVAGAAGALWTAAA